MPSANAGTEEVSLTDCQATAAIIRVASIQTPPASLEQSRRPIPSHGPSFARRQASLTESPLDLSVPIDTSLRSKPDAPTSFLYLAYGSNLAAATFLGRRGIRPLSQVNVVVPELVMTFDLPGLPYTEPCFANSAYRSHKPPATAISDSEKAALLPDSERAKYSNPHWPKGLVGVVYEVTPSDFAHIIATEGGGASYQDVLVDCYVLPSSTTTVPAHPTTAPFKAHTLLDPIAPPDQPPPRDGGRFSRPDPEYAQPSARYIKLITDGADEHGLPEEYKVYLHELQPYTITTNKQRLGRFVFMMTWYPLVMAMFQLARLFQDKNGLSPPWLVMLTGAVFRGVWISYDGFFKGLFGDGERTIEKGHDDEGVQLKRRPRKLIKRRLYDALNEKGESAEAVV